MVQDLSEKVEAYLQRMKKDRVMPRYPLEEKGTFVLIGGSYLDSGRKESSIFYQGRFIDAIASAVDEPSYYGDWCSNVDNPNNGYLKKVLPARLPKSKEMSKLIRRRRT